MLYIVPETNFLRIPYNKEHTDYTVFHFNKNLDSLQKLKHTSHLNTAISIVLPELVCRELQQHKVEAYRDACQRWEKLCNSFGDYAKGEIYIDEKQFSEELKQQFQMRIDEYEMAVMPICKSDCFESIIERALAKNPPFEGKEKESDKGFKDTVLWYSILDFAKANHGEYILITNDNVFHNNINELTREFKEITGNDLHIFRTYDDVLQHVVVKENEKYIDSVDINEETREIILKHSNTEYMARLHYLQPKVFASEEVLTFINHDIKKIYDNALGYWEGVDLERVQGGDEYIGKMEYEVLYNQDGILSLIFEGNINLGNQLVSNSKIGRVYDLSKGCVLGLCDLLGESEDQVLQKLMQQWEKDKEEKGNDVYWDNFIPVFKRTDDVKFYLDNKGIHVFFDIDEAASCAEGFVEFNLINLQELPIAKKRLDFV